MEDLARKEFVDKQILIKERITKTKSYISKHGYLKMFCSMCGKLFFCSGECVSILPPSEIYLESILGNTCLCENCDAAKGFDSMHYRGCGKNDQIGMVIKAMAKENPK